MGEPNVDFSMPYTGEENGLGQRSQHVRGLGNLSNPHLKCHEGLLYTVSVLEPGVADDGTLDLLLQVPAGIELHSGVGAYSEGKAYLYIYEATTFSDAGSALVLRNNKRSSADNTAVTATKAPTITGLGNLLFETLVPGGTGAKTVGASDGALARGGAEWILSPSTDYLFRLTNKGGAAKDLSENITFYTRATS